nr:MAG TPA: Super-infection exclusion protein B [Caudoviricetes sp.]
MPLLIIILLILFLPIIAWPLLFLFAVAFFVGYGGAAISDYIAKRNPKYAAWREKRKAEKEKAQIEWDAIKEAMRLDKEEHQRKVRERALEINRGIKQRK